MSFCRIPLVSPSQGSSRNKLGSQTIVHEVYADLNDCSSLSGVLMR